MIRPFLLCLSRGHDFRVYYGMLETLSSVFLSTKIVTGAYHKAMGYMKNPSLVIANPDGANIFYEVIQRPPCKAKECR